MLANPSYGANGVYGGVEKEEENAEEYDNGMGVYGMEKFEWIEGHCFVATDLIRLAAISCTSSASMHPIGLLPNSPAL